MKDTKSRPLLVIDEDIAAGDGTFESIGAVRRIPGRQIRRHHLKDADVLLVRSVTRVDDGLLADTRVHFVGTATSGTDHIDLECVKRRGIRFADARGSNANAVVEYVAAALVSLSATAKVAPSRPRVGIVGAGQVGGRVLRLARAMGYRPVVYDPFLSTSDRQKLAVDLSIFRSLDEVLESDIISLHVPLSRDGDHPTYHLLDEERIESLHPGTVLINTSRGEVIDESALLRRLARRADLTCVFDVWSDEPDVNVDLVREAAIATPHIAGFSLEAKRAAAGMLAVELYDYFGLVPGPRDIPQTLPLLVSANRLPDIVGLALPLDALSAQFKFAVAAGAGPSFFDSMRAAQRSRREFSAWRVGTAALERRELERLKTLGFTVEEPSPGWAV